MSFKRVHFKWPLEEPEEVELAFPPGSARRSNSLSPKKIIRRPCEIKPNETVANLGNVGTTTTKEEINYFPNAYVADGGFDPLDKLGNFDKDNVVKTSKSWLSITLTSML